MLSWQHSIANVGALYFALTVASPSVAEFRKHCRSVQHSHILERG